MSEEIWGFTVELQCCNRRAAAFRAPPLVAASENEREELASRITQLEHELQAQQMVRSFLSALSFNNDVRAHLIRSHLIHNHPHPTQK